MELRYFRCAKCENLYHMADRMVKPDMQCGALMGFVVRGDAEVPYGCGGTMQEITQHKANELAYEKRG